jgi:predicted RNase H-like HicB family nuclease
MERRTARMRRYAIVIETAGDNFSGYVPDLPVVIATGDTPDEVADLLRAAIDLYLEALLEDGEPLPEPPQTVDARVVDVAS